MSISASGSSLFLLCQDADESEEPTQSTSAIVHGEDLAVLMTSLLYLLIVFRNFELGYTMPMVVDWCI